MEAGRRSMSVSMVGTRKVTSKSLVCPQVLQQKLHPVHGHADNDAAMPSASSIQACEGVEFNAFDASLQ